jgi:preprotein translocase subunit SecF
MKVITEKNYKKLMMLPFLMVVICLILIFIYPGVSKGIDLKGGNQLILRYDGAPVDQTKLEASLKGKYGFQELSIRETTGPTSTGVIIEYSNSPEVETAKAEKAKLDFTNTALVDLKSTSKSFLAPLLAKNYISQKDADAIDSFTNKEDLKVYINETIILANNNFNNSIVNFVKSDLGLGDDARIQTREISATLGSDFIKASIKVGIIAFILLSFVIFLFFRELVPSGLIIFAATFDILAGLAGMAILGLPLSLTTIPTLLMLVGYSVDTDILLSTKLLKNRTDDVFTATNKSMATGLTMTITTIVTVLVMVIVSYFMQMTVILEIASILLFGLIGDIISTWFFNAPALITYVQRKNKNKN